jgi:TPR repeat protein
VDEAQEEAAAADNQDTQDTQDNQDNQDTQDNQDNQDNQEDLPAVELTDKEENGYNNLTAAYAYMEQGAELGSRNALTDMGYMKWQSGYGSVVPPNKTEAAALFKRATSTTDVKLFGQPASDAAFFLGTMAMSGDGIPRNHTLAFEMFELAASLGNRRARFNIGHMHHTQKAPIPDKAPSGSANTCEAAVEAWKQVAEASVLTQLEGARAAFIGGNMFQSLLLYMSAAEKGSVNGQVNTAWLLEQQAEHSVLQVELERTVMTIAGAAGTGNAATESVPQLRVPAASSAMDGDATDATASTTTVQSALVAVGASVGAILFSKSVYGSAGGHTDGDTLAPDKYWLTTALPDMAEAMHEQAGEQPQPCRGGEGTCEDGPAGAINAVVLAGNADHTGAMAVGGEEALDAVDAVRFAHGASSRMHALRYYE